MPRRTYSSADGVIARAGRAHEDPAEMTRDATWARLAKHIAAALKANPDLTAEQAARAGRLTMKAEMARNGRASGAARRARAAQADTAQ